MKLACLVAALLHHVDAIETIGYQLRLKGSWKLHIEECLTRFNDVLQINRRPRIGIHRDHSAGEITVIHDQTIFFTPHCNNDERDFGGFVDSLQRKRKLFLGFLRQVVKILQYDQLLEIDCP